MADSGSKERLLRLADEIEGLPKAFPSAWPGEGEIADAAGRRFDEALRLGAFSGDEHLRLRLLVERQHTNYPDRFHGIWDEAVACLCEELARAHGSAAVWVDACPAIANAIRGEADSVGEKDACNTQGGIELSDLEGGVRDAFREVSGYVIAATRAAQGLADLTALSKHLHERLQTQGVMGHLYEAELQLAKAVHHFPVIEQQLTSLHTEPPEPIAGASGPTHHAIALNLCQQIIFEAYVAAGMTPPVVSPPFRSEKEMRESATQAGTMFKTVIRKLERFREVDWDRLVDMIEIESANAAKAESDRAVRIAIEAGASNRSGGKEPHNGESQGQAATAPNEKAIQAHWFAQAGYSQARIAEMLEVSQGTVSRWKAKVTEWVQLGHAIPAIKSLKPMDRKPDTIDPDDINAGARVDQHTPRQRKRRSDNESEG